MINCKRCLDVGVLELHQGSFSTLGLCICKAGRQQTWKLPRIPMQGYTDSPVDYTEFKPKVISPNIISSMSEKVQWWKSRVRMAEEFWVEEQKKSDNEPEGAA